MGYLTARDSPLVGTSYGLYCVIPQDCQLVFYSIVYYYTSQLSTHLPIYSLWIKYTKMSLMSLFVLRVQATCQGFHGRLPAKAVLSVASSAIAG